MSTGVIYAFDVGGIGNCGWAETECNRTGYNVVGSGDIRQLVDYMVGDARQGKSIATADYRGTLLHSPVP